MGESIKAITAGTITIKIYYMDRRQPNLGLFLGVALPDDLGEK
jgi:hypothetical protein